MAKTLQPYNQIRKRGDKLMEQEKCLHEVFNHTHHFSTEEGFCAIKCANVKCGEIFLIGDRQ